MPRATVVTVSDTCARGEREDVSGPEACRILRDAGFEPEGPRVVPDERAAIAKALRDAARASTLVVTTGGTGLAARDVTPEASRTVIERPTPGLDEAMRAASLLKTPHAALSRGVSGIRGSTLIVNLPGSERAAGENLSAILPALGHGLAKLRGDPAECGRPPTTVPTRFAPASKPKTPPD